MQARHGDISYSDVRVMTSANVQLQSFFHIDNMNNFACIGADGLEDNVLRFYDLPSDIIDFWLGCVILNDIEHLFTVETASFIGVSCLAELAL